MTARRFEPLSDEVRRQRQLQCIRCDLNTIKTHAARINAIIDLEGLPLVHFDIAAVDAFRRAALELIDQAERAAA